MATVNDKKVEIDKVVATPPQIPSAVAKSPAEPGRKADHAKTALLVLIATTAGFGGGLLGSRSLTLRDGNLANTQSSQQIISSESELISEITKNVGPSVVSISVTAQGVSEGFFGLERYESEGAGTGVIISDDGLVITNRHVVPTGTTAVSVTLSDGTKLDDVEIIGRTSASDPLDIAFLKIKDTKGKDLTPAVLGDSSNMEVGDRVVAIGNALGQFQNTVTSGIISGFGRDIEAGSGLGSSVESLQNLFQTDAAINPGNSGGPLVNVNGEVIGINVAVAEAQSIGFAIPINDVKGLITSVREKGRIERPYLGVRYISLTDDVAYFYNLETKRGALVVPAENNQPSIIPGSPAEKAGIRERDIITAINDQKIDEKNSLVSIVSQFSVGDTVKVTLIRNGQEMNLDIKLEAAPED